MRALTRLLLCAALFAVRIASADSSSTDDIARSHYKAGQAMYDAHRYLDAVREFDAGYQRSHRARFLVNIAQAYRAAGYLTASQDYYRRFLRETPLDDPEHGEVTRILGEVDAAIAQSGPGPTAPPMVAPPVLVKEVIYQTAPPPKPKRWPIALGVTLGVVLVAGAITVGVVLGTRGHDTALPLQSAR